MTTAHFFRFGRVVLVLAILFPIGLAGCAPVRHYEAVRVLQDLAAGTGDSRLKRTTPGPLRQPLAYTVAGRAHHADLYLPAALDGCVAWSPAPSEAGTARCPRAALVAVPGAVPQGKDDPRMVAFATTL
ncbi:MAG TPA: hypothetical protein VK910_05135, partial [Thiobacillus sp.]|nr:hypothetical protein [Thiobacillus sp.]